MIPISNFKYRIFEEKIWSEKQFRCQLLQKFVLFSKIPIRVWKKDLCVWMLSYLNLEFFCSSELFWKIEKRNWKKQCVNRQTVNVPKFSRTKTSAVWLFFRKQMSDGDIFPHCVNKKNQTKSKKRFSFLCISNCLKNRFYK